MKVAEDCELAGDFEPIEQEITISIHGVGFSLVNNVTRSELLYLCIARYVIYILICFISANCYRYQQFLLFSSGIIWETRKSVSHRWRGLSTREVNVIEEGYQKYMRELQIGKDPVQKAVLEPKLEVTRVKMIIS